MTASFRLPGALALAAATVVTLATPLPSRAQTPPPAAQALVPAQSEVTFVARQLGVPLNGRFKAFSVQSTFNPKALATSQVAFSIDLGSVAINAETDAELSKPDWFHTARFPKATFQSTAIKATGPGRYDVSGRLSIKGQARDLVVPVQMTQANGLTTAVGGFTLKRLDFNVGGGDWGDPSIVANEVQVKFKLTLKGVPAL